MEDLGYVKPRSVKLGEMYVQKKVRRQFRIVLKEICVFNVPFFDQLQELLKMPEVQESLNIHARQNCGEFEFTDICDGVYFQKEYIQTHQNVLFSIYHDDFEIVNPIGSHKKKHKMSIFYWNLLNLPQSVVLNFRIHSCCGIFKTCKKIWSRKIFGKFYSKFARTIQWKKI